MRSHAQPTTMLWLLLDGPGPGQAGCWLDWAMKTAFPESSSCATQLHVEMNTCVYSTEITLQLNKSSRTDAVLPHTHATQQQIGLHLPAVAYFFALMPADVSFRRCSKDFRVRCSASSILTSGEYPRSFFAREMSKRRLLAAILIRLRVNSDAASGRPTSLNSGMTCVCKDDTIKGHAQASAQVFEISIICQCHLGCWFHCDTATHQILKYASQKEDQTKRQLDARPPVVQPLSMESNG